MIGGNQVMTAVEQNTLKRRGVGMKAFDPERACPGFTLFAPLFVESRTVYLIDLQGKVVHTWKMPYSPGLSGYLTERGTLYYNGRYPEDNFLSRFPFKGGVALEADWSGKVLWEVRHPGQHHDGVLLRNGLKELPDGDILASFRPTSTVIRISRKTSKILWKLGPPTVSGQHAPTPLANGNVLIFDNGTHRLDDSMPYSRVIEVNPATNEIVWKYQDSPAWNFFSPRMGNGQRLPNGNTLITESSFGRLFEVTREGEIVWEYVSPFFGKPLFGGREGSESNQVFRAYRYSDEEIARARRNG